MSDSLKRKTGIALFWSFVDKAGQQVIQLVFMFVLARLITKEDFGLVAVLAIFTAVANLLQESGFSSALIRKKEVLAEEFSSVFYFNIFISFFIYLILFFCAPLISLFYEKPILTDLSRFIFLAFVFNSFGIIQNVHLIRNMNFKTNTRITFIAGCISGVVAVYMAFNGFGVWSLAAQQVIQTFLRSTFLWIFIKWKPEGGFVFSHIKSMFPFSVKLLLTSILNQVTANIYSIILGKYFSFSQGGSYSQANKLNSIPQSVISDGIKGVAYPLLTRVEDDPDRKKRAFRKIMRISAFISFPVAFMLITMAKPIIVILLSNRWIDATPILQILAIGGSIYPLYALISALLQHLSRSGLLFKIEFFRNILSLVTIFISIRFEVLGLVTGISLVNIISFLVGIYISGKYISYSLKEVLYDICPYFSIAAISFAPMLFLNRLEISNIYLLFFIPFIAGSCLYLLIIKMLGSVILQETIDFVKQSLKLNK